MAGSEGELLRTPYDGRLSVEEWPWDFMAVFNLKRYLINVQREIDFNKGMPEPTKRSYLNFRGFEKWKKWIADEQAVTRKRAEKDPPRIWERGIDGWYVVFDYYTPGGIAYAHARTGEIKDYETLVATRRKRRVRTGMSRKGEDDD